MLASDIGCEYGDQATWCSTATLTREVCTSSTGSVCCASCRSVLANASPPKNAASMTMCPQKEDPASYCSNLKPSECYSSSSTCCVKCSSYRISTNPPGKLI